MANVPAAPGMPNTLPSPAGMHSPQPHDAATCDMCRDDGGEVLLRHEKLRIVLVDDALYPGFCRVIWRAHVPELTDLPPADRSLLMMVVCKVEQAMRQAMAPHKVNLASLGNMTPHLHWHVIPRFPADAHFPQPVWGVQQRTPDTAWFDAQRALLPALRDAIAAQCATLGAGGMV